MDTATILHRYYDAFHREDHAALLELLSDDVAHDINQGDTEHGKEAFAAFLLRMQRCYKERLEDLVILFSPDGTRAAAEFTVHGTYLAADEGLPPAHGQSYILPAGAFFAIANGKIQRVTVYYNLPSWLAQVAALPC